jgi:hypothetical protein
MVSAPLLFLSFSGIYWAIKLLIVMAFTALAIFGGFAAGLSISFLFQPDSYWQNYHFPVLWTATWMKSLTLDDPMWKYMVAPIYIFAVDIWRIYFDFSIRNFSFTLFIPEVIGWITAIKIVKYAYIDNR